jgi:hypothetical protein
MCNHTGWPVLRAWYSQWCWRRLWVVELERDLRNKWSRMKVSWEKGGTCPLSFVFCYLYKVSLIITFELNDNETSTLLLELHDFDAQEIVKQCSCWRPVETSLLACFFLAMNVNLNKSLCILWFLKINACTIAPRHRTYFSKMGNKPQHLHRNVTTGIYEGKIPPKLYYGDSFQTYYASQLEINQTNLSKCRFSYILPHLCPMCYERAY